MDTSEIELDIELTEADTDPERFDQLTYQVMNDLYELGAESIERPKGGPIPEGAKGDPITLGALALIAVPAMLPNLVSFLQAWTLRGENRKVKIRTSAGLEVEFTPDKKLSETELLSLVQKLSGTQ